MKMVVFVRKTIINPKKKSARRDWPVCPEAIDEPDEDIAPPAADGNALVVHFAEEHHRRALRRPQQQVGIWAHQGSNAAPSV